MGDNAHLLPELEIVIPTLDRPALLARTLARLERQRAAAGRFGVIVVTDPASGDAAAVDRAIAARRFPAMRVDRDQPGVSAARNAGWRTATAPLILFLGDDILPTRDLVRTHLEAHAREPEVEAGILGHVRWIRWPPPTAFMRWLEDGIQFDYRRLTPGAAAPWWHFYTANASVKRAMLERVGGFDAERFPFGYEDLDIAARMAQHGWRLRYVPTALAEHVHPQTLADWRARVAQIAPAERVFCARHPEATPYFHDLFVAARRHPPARGRGALLAPVVPRRTPWLGPRVWASFDMRNRQALADPFLNAWETGAKPPAGARSIPPATGASPDARAGGTGRA
jgi:GT2 family glycosyltransferase